jgi:coenzyme Q-binding protein COQ10
VNKTDKIILIFYIFLASSFGLYVFTYDVGLEESLLEVVTPKKITEFEASRLIDVSNNRIFNVMADIENFPNILPENVVSVNILDRTDNEIIAEEELFEAGIKIKLLVKHTIKPYSEHIIEIIDGDAEGTKITQYFESVDSQTKLTTNVNLKVKGVTSIIAFVPETNLVHAINTVISHFVQYSKYNVYEITVNSIYQEILDRQADEESLSHFSSLLRDGQITEQDLRFALLNSEERVFKQKTIDELNEETINVINDLYEKILLREADPEGLAYFGSLFESGVTSDKIRAMLLESDEGKNISFNHPVRSKITTVFALIFDTSPDNSYVDHYQKMIDDGLMPFPDWIENILLWKQKGMISDNEIVNSIRFLYNEGMIFPDDKPPRDELVEYRN